MNSEKPGPGRVFLSRCLHTGAPEGTVLLRRALLPWGPVLALALLLPLAWAGPLGGASAAWAAASGTHQQPAQTKKQPLHGQPWAFGQSEDRKDALWRRGVPAQSLKQRAVNAKGAKGSPRAAGSAGRAAKATGSKAPAGTGARSAGGNGAMDTESGISSALSAAQGGTARAGKPKGSMGLSMENETTTWNVTPMREAMRPDEVQARESRHVVRAFADLEPTDDLSISVGPELILKDEQHGAESAGSSQPDSALGLGMQFKLDF